MDTLALIAHDNQKATLIDWAKRHIAILKGFQLITTGTTGRLLKQATGLPVKSLQSGPLGGDQQIGAEIVEGRIHAIIFFWDPLSSMPHDPDVRALLRLATLWNIPMACNEASADFIIGSPLWQTGYRPSRKLVEAYLKERDLFQV